MSIIAYPLENTEYTAEDVQIYLSTRTSGVYSDDITLETEGMTATISPFFAWFNYAKFKGCAVAVTQPETLSFEPSHTVLDRIDRVALRLDLNLNRAYLTVISGVSASNPTPPSISRTEALYDVSPFYVRIRAGSSEILPSDITNTIYNENVCGIMRDGITNEAFMLGGVYDPNKKSKPVAFMDEVVSKSGGDMVGHIRNVNRESFAALLKERELESGQVYSVAFGSGLGQGSVTGSLELAEITGGKYEIVARLDMGSEDLKYRNASGVLGRVFSELNKPSGTYTGTGSSSPRTIHIGSGIGEVLFIDSDFGSAFVTGSGAFGFVLGEVKGNANVTYSDGELYINTSNEMFNKSGTRYSYRLM